MESKERSIIPADLGTWCRFFWSRQTQFERFFFGNTITVSNRLYKANAQDHSQRERVRQFLGNLEQ